MANSVDPNQTAPIGAVCSGSTLFASIFNLPVTLGNYLQQRERSGSVDRVLDLRRRGRRFEPHQRHCVVVLEQDTFILA